MQKQYMWKPYIRSLIHSIGGIELRGEGQKGYLSRVSLCTGVGFSALRAAYYGRDTDDGRYLGNNDQPVTKENINKLQQAAENARDTWAIIAFTENQIAIWETEPVRFRARIDAAREFLGRLRRDAEEERRAVEVTGEADCGSGDENVGGEE